MSKVCNFENDCPDGEDELRCGSCNFQIKPENCGLTFIPDKAFTWFRQHSKSNEDDDDEVSSYRSKKTPFNYMFVDVAQNHKQYLERGHSSQNIVYRPKVLFPHLKSTNNEKCSFAFDIFVTEKPAKLSDYKGKSSWPNIRVLLIQPKDKEEEYFIKGSGAKEYKFYDLNLEKTIEDSNKLMWVRKEVLLGSRSTVWTLELVVELEIKSFLIHLSNFKFLNCQNIAENSNDESIKSNENDLLDLNDDCDKNQFKCALSGVCIDKSLLCDYGYDCGDDDTSDEEFCDEYPGRCDFEEETKCDWTSSPSFNSWIWMSAQEDDQAGYEKEAHLISRPHVDHTYMSDGIGGHYMLLNTQKLSESSMYRFIGPNVALRDGAEECSFRFWVYTPTSLDNITFESAYLMAGNKRILSSELFNHKSNWESPIKNDAFNSRSLSQNWKRYEIQILDKYKRVEGSLFAQITFGKLSKNDLNTFSDNKGFIALDDFSFTPGCALTFEGEVVDNMCGDNEFFCRIPTIVTNVFCIPIEYYCDFKNDCGSFKSNGEATIDEQDCPHECLFHKGEHCGYEIVDGDDLKEVGEINENRDINEAFSYVRVYDPTSKQGYLLISAHGDKFLSRFGQGMVNLRNFRIELPTFSVSQANCLFELTYLWTPDSKNTFALVSIESEQLTWQTVLKRLRPTRNSMMEKTTVTLGVGHRSQPFKVVIELLFEGNLTEYTSDKAKQRIGSLYLYEYKFINCNFAHGLITSKTYIQFEEPADDYGFVDYPLSVPTVNNSCKPGFFQCLEPSVCIENKYVCDMQIDCQTSELDEMDCGHDLRFTFEDCDINELPQGWLSSNSDGFKSWSVATADRHNSPELSPPFDHTLSVEEGKFLIIKGKSNSDNKELIINLARSQNRTNHESPACRMIFYLYFKISSLESHFRVFRGKDSSGSDRKLIFEAKIGSEEKEIASISDSQVEAWHRVELANFLNRQEAGAANSGSSEIDQISIVFEVSLSEHEFIALDDVSFSSACELEGQIMRKKKKKNEENIEFGRNSISQDENTNLVKENNTNNENDLRLSEDKPSSELFLLVLLAFVMVGSLVTLALVSVFVKPLINRVNLRKLNWRRFAPTSSRSRNANESVAEVSGDGTYFTLNNLESGN